MPRSSTSPVENEPLDTRTAVAEADISFLLVRAFYDLRGMLERLLKASPLAEHVQPGMGPLLYALYDKDNCTIREIGERVLLAPSTLTNTLKRMEKANLVSLTPCENDGRAVRVRLTAHARKLRKDMNQLRQQVRQALHGKLSDDDVQKTKSLLTLLIDQMANHEWECNHPQNQTRRTPR